MEQPRQDLTGRLLRAVQDVPDDKIGEAIDFVEYLQSKYGQRQPPRGSAEAILQGLRETGGLQFEPGELESLLAQIEQDRDSELDTNG
jgi:hypothetical protein